MKKIGIYARVSTTKQETENQIIKLKEYVKLREWDLIDVYSDPAISGRKASRPELNRMKTDIKKGKINGVLVWKLDRLGRSVKDSIELSDYFRIHNCSFISYNNNIDTTTPEGKFFFTIIAAFAEMEASFISERTKLAYDVKQKHAELLGQKVKWGRKKKDVDDEIINYWKENKHKSFGEIAKELNLTKSIVYRRIKSFQKGLCKNGE